MTVLAEALINARLDAEGQITDLHIGIIDWPYADLEPAYALIVEKCISAYDEEDPAALLVLMDDKESMMQVSFKASEKVRKFLSRDLRHRDSLFLTRLPALSAPLVGGNSTTNVVHYETACSVYATTEEAIAALADIAV